MVQKHGVKGEERTAGCCGAYCEEVCECVGTIAKYAYLQAKSREGMDGEMKMVAAMASNEERTGYLNGVAEARGKQAAVELRRRVWEFMKAGDGSDLSSPNA